MWKMTSGGIAKPQGFLAAGTHAGFKKTKLDLALITCEEATVAGVFTQNAFAASPVKLTKKHIASGKIKALIVNSGNANACNGQLGDQDALRTAELVAHKLGINPDEVAVSSTGVIGVPLNMWAMAFGIEDIAVKLSKEGGRDAASAIMTTDTYPKEVTIECNLDGITYTISGIAKGSGMIHPNMATMLAFITTDWPLERDLLQTILKEIADETFNAISVDGDTSTNDMCLVLSSNELPSPSKNKIEIFKTGLKKVMSTLAKAIVLDGEGATKLLKITVKNALSIQDAKFAAKAIGHSPLVKTAFFGEDANWGRIICALGYSGCTVEPNKTDLYFEKFQVVKGGRGTGVSDLELMPILKSREIEIVVDLNLGSKEYTFQTTDFSYDYVKINGNYRS
ncbi:MAG: bifunctional glutamate N-acetyltransferase/amino-acid acetyltransferase ArgJ [Firmicutes bacterium]|nr:bifunctional glutamate N-acetyltransferase/amino-acid acetyltransferase ArgJ [Bacillota bacterium]MDD4692901.1 bifunctional glutamate N-acetyltransferase/amino-acid acetyltransferase ArgJ [Bacillota bacterium]